MGATFPRADGQDDPARPRGPQVIAHRGASHYLLEHTLEGYTAGYLMGADFVEPDVVATADGVLICNHDVELDQTTDASSIYPDRARADGRWHAIDFTFEEIRRLRRVPRDRTGATSMPRGGSTIPTLDEAIALVRRLNERTGRRVGIIPEIKRPSVHREQGVAYEELISGVLASHSWINRDDPVVIQCFEWDALERLRKDVALDVPLMALCAQEDPKEIDLDGAAQVAQWLGPSRRAMEDDQGNEIGGAAFVEAAHERGLRIAPWTFKDEPAALTRFFRDYRVDALFADDPLGARRAADQVALPVDRGR